MKEFTWHCGASVLVDDAYATWDVKATSIEDAWYKAIEHAINSNVLDSGSLDMEMDIKELATELSNMAIEDNNDYVSDMLLEELESIKDKKELITTLELLVCNNNTKVERLSDCYE